MVGFLKFGPNEVLETHLALVLDVLGVLEHFLQDSPFLRKRFSKVILENNQGRQ